MLLTSIALRLSWLFAYRIKSSNAPSTSSIGHNRFGIGETRIDAAITEMPGG